MSCNGNNGQQMVNCQVLFKSRLFLTGCLHRGSPESSQLLMRLLQSQWVQHCSWLHMRHAGIIAIAFFCDFAEGCCGCSYNSGVLRFIAIAFASRGIALSSLLMNCSLLRGCILQTGGFVSLAFAILRASSLLLLQVCEMHCTCFWASLRLACGRFREPRSVVTVVFASFTKLLQLLLQFAGGSLCLLFRAHGIITVTIASPWKA